MGDHERFRIDRLAADGRPIEPKDVARKIVKQCRVLVRHCIPITVQEWHKPKEEGVSYVGDKGKETHWKKLLHNFTLPEPEPEVDSDEDDPNEEDLQRMKFEIEQKVKKWALKKMA